MEDPKPELHNPYVSIWLEGTIMMGIYHSNTVIDLAIAKDIVKTRISIFGTEPRLAIIEIGDSISASKEARDYLGSKEACIGLKKLAILARSPISATLGNFYLKISRPPAPTKIFSNKEAARKWLLRA